MSIVQKLVVAVVPKKWAANIEAQSRLWMAQCQCGAERSFWEAGGIRWKGSGTERVYLACPFCKQTHWHRIYKKTAPT